ncbi:ribose 5-phosphate isomerase [Ignisphaera aggregans DSM 17230]|uniref:Ribose 5-phosphate isomerase A n=1 Tax=Ignisphaera aggregans (strain DSM 17230 / JCM 13409 / AQ1.S1) TaxID=583356 RepID=E0SPG1_IGNAA|nr:ribose 5-phosphate isomerase [Ignisphaera aggregans DSM 17230]
MLSIEELRIRASLKALDYLVSLCRDGCILGLGTGSTVRFFINTLLDKGYSYILKKSIVIVSSIDTALYLLNMGIENIESGLPRDSIDLYIDSADEVDYRRYMIKGGGGAMLREKILTMLSHRKIFIVDENKLSPTIGTKKPVPIEIEPFSYPLIKKYLNDKGYKYEIRYAKNRYGPELTDNGNMIIDVYTGPLNNPRDFITEIELIPGVVTTGIFEPLNNSIIIVGKQNTIEVI